MDHPMCHEKFRFNRKDLPEMLNLFKLKNKNNSFHREKHVVWCNLEYSEKQDDVVT